MLYQEISSSVIFVDNIYGSNMVCIALGKELIFVDSGLRTIITQEFRKAMEKKFKRKGSTLIISHAHIDHFLGMGAFSDCKVIAAESGKERFTKFVNLDYNEQVVENFAKIFPSFKEAIQEANLFMPTIWIKDKMILGNNQLTFQVVSGHSSCSSAVYLADEKIMITGDLLQVDAFPYFGEPDTDIQKWIATLKTWEQMNIKTFLPGHGRWVDKQYLSNVRKYFEDLVVALKSLKKEKMTIEDVLKHPSLPKGYWPKEVIKKPSFDYSITNLYKQI